MSIKWENSTAEVMEQVRVYFGSRLTEAILFGSRARGGFANDSDIDILLFVENLSDNDKKWITDFESDYLLENSILFSIYTIDITKKKFEREPFVINARKEGINV